MNKTLKQPCAAIDISASKGKAYTTIVTVISAASETSSLSCDSKTAINPIELVWANAKSNLQNTAILLSKDSDEVSEAAEITAKNVTYRLPFKVEQLYHAL